MTDIELLDYAKEAMEHAYAPYSHFRVGAALQASNGKVYLGCNIENASYGATNCAERTAIFKAVSEGERDFDRIAIVCSEGRKAYPCGICLQVMSEFLPNGTVVLEDKEGIYQYSVQNLLPAAFQMTEGNHTDSINE